MKWNGVWGHLVFFLRVCLRVCLFVFGKHFNRDHNIWTVRDRDAILGMHTIANDIRINAFMTLTMTFYTIKDNLGFVATRGIHVSQTHIIAYSLNPDHEL